jgi:hypothetical protein
MTHEYPRGLRGPVVQDVALAIAWVVLFAFLELPRGARILLLCAIPIVFAWGLVTLHFPSRVEIDGEGVRFARYGRAHRFAWKDVERVRVRRFLVRDRVLVRIEPSGGAWRGRYWLLDSIDEFENVVRELEARGSQGRSGSQAT